MKLTRTTALAALLLVALAAPVAAFALDEDSTGRADTHADGGKHDKDKDKDKQKKSDEKADNPNKGEDKPGHATGRERAAEASAAGRAHAEAMKAWTDCVAKAASGPKDEDDAGPPKEECGEKPVGPGRAKHESDSSDRSAPPGKSKDHPRGKSQSQRSH
jgi:hypothetical protein